MNIRREYACKYLERCNKESKSNDGINREAYAKLVELDTRLGTTASKQLYYCLANTTRSDIIKVLKFLLMKDLKFFRLSIWNKFTNCIGLQIGLQIGKQHVPDFASMYQTLPACTRNDFSTN